MNFKMKLAALAAIAALSAPAFAVTGLGNATDGASSAVKGVADITAEGDVILKTEDGSGSTVFVDFAFDDGGNAALVSQAGDTDIAYIDQSTGKANYAFINQSTDAIAASADAAAIIQTGSNNRAVVYQH